MDKQPGLPTTPVASDPARLVREHQAGIWRYLRVLGCSAEEAADLTQETFLNVLQRPFVEHNIVATAAYLRKVAHNLWVSLRRRSGRVEAVADVEALDTQWSRWVGADNGDSAIDALRECLKRLSERARLALELRFRDRESRARIAARLQLSEHGAKNLLQRAKQQLRECIEGKLK